MRTSSTSGIGGCILAAPHIRAPQPNTRVASEFFPAVIAAADERYRWRGTPGICVIDAVSATRVRYCWADAPLCNLYGKSGLPVASFEVRLTP